MTNNKELSNTALIVRGYLIVNIPVTALILVIWFGLWSLFHINNLLSVLIGTLIGWYYWAYSIEKWIKWAYSNNANQDKIFKIGRLGLLLWKRQTVIDALDNGHKKNS